MPSSIAASVPMASAAALLNDAAQAEFTNTLLLPYLKIAYGELQEKLEENNVPMINSVSAPITITTAMTDIGGTTGPALPADLVEIQSILERSAGGSEDFIEMTGPLEFLPSYSAKTTSLVYWAWQSQVVKFLGATGNREVKLQYIGLTLGSITGPNSNINFYQAELFLGFRTGALAARFITEDTGRADALDAMAVLSIDRVININSKNSQSMPVRRRPFMASHKASQR